MCVPGPSCPQPVLSEARRSLAPCNTNVLHFGNDRESYKGVPLGDLAIDSIAEWTEERANHIRTRSERYPGDFDIEPEWATEAALDPARVVRVASDGENSSLKVIGWSPGAGRLLKVWIWSDDPQGSDVWTVGSAAAANKSDIKKYEETS